jgi:ribosomal protein S18 acetylase RimI-like enzyme
VPREDGRTEATRLTQTGDCAAAHAGGAIETPVWRHKKQNGCCFRCTLGKDKWSDITACAKARRRNFVYQCAANHVNPWPLLPGVDATGRPWSERPPPKCPHCGVTVNAALMAKEKAELEAAPTPAKQKEILREHAGGHAGGMRGRIPILPTDNRSRSRGILHRRMNIVSNCIAATFMKVKFSSKQRVAANLLLKARKMIWRMPETSGKQRAKTIAAGNDARRFLSDPLLLKGLFEIFYPDADEAEAAQLDALGAAAEGNANVRSEEMAEETADSAAPAAAAPAAAPRTQQSRKSATGVQGGGVQKKSTSTKKGKKKAAVAAVAGPRGRSVDESDVREYARKRKAAACAARAGEEGSAGARTNPEAEAQEKEAEDEKDTEGEMADTSLEADNDDEDMEDFELEEDETVGGFASAVEVWLAAIRYTAALHATCDDPFDKEAIKVHAKKCGETGRAWAVAINDHTKNKSRWQYVHDAFAHVEEDILEHGFGDRNDDSILEKGNRRKKRLGDRCVFRGGTNRAGARFQQTRRVKERDAHGRWTGRYTKSTVSRRANLGAAAQVLRLDLIAQLCEEARQSASASLSAKEIETKAEEKLARAAAREATLTSLEALAAKAKGGGAEDEGSSGGSEGMGGGGDAATADAVMDDAGASGDAGGEGGEEGGGGVEVEFETMVCNAAPAELVEQLVAIERSTMIGHDRNGAPFADYFNDKKETLHVATAGGKVVGFAIHSTWRGRGGTTFLYELHSTIQRAGIGTGLLELVVQPNRTRAKVLELQVHKGNIEAQEWYARRGFLFVISKEGERVEVGGGLAYLMRKIV